ncbi:MAG: hypothetical protein ACPG4W_04170 [Flavobacteriales bacterium]
MLNDFNSVVSTEYLTSAVDYHQSHPAFRKRPITTFLIKETARHAEISIGMAFVIINFLFLFISGVLLYRLALRFENTNTMAIGNVIIYFTSFSIMFAFFSPIYTYDEPIQFCLLLLGLLSIYKEKWLAYILFFSLSIIARESSLILLPGLILMTFYKKEPFNFRSVLSKENVLKMTYLLAPIVVYVMFLIIFLKQNNMIEESESDVLNRLSHFHDNVQDPKHAFESLISFFLVLGTPLYLLYNGVKKNMMNDVDSEKYLRAFLITVLINSAIVLLTTKAREARLFVVPMFFIWPLFTRLFYEDIKLLISLKNYKSTFSNLSYVASFTFLNGLNYILSFKIYETTIGHPNDNYFNEYLFAMLFIILTHATLKHNLNDC